MIDLKNEVDVNIKDREQAYHALVVATSDVVYQAGIHGEPIGRNFSWQKFTGQSELDIEMGRWAEAVHPDDRDAVIKVVSNALIERTPYRVENRLRRFDGEWRYMEVNGVPLFDKKGEVYQWIGCCKDITERKKMELELREALTSRDEFLSIASHELRTPLTSLFLHLQMLSRIVDVNCKDMGLGIPALVKKAVKSCAQINSMINELLDITRIRIGKVILNKQKVDLGASIENCISFMSEEIARSGSKISVELDKSITGQWDAIRINQIISNLLSNAVKYGEGKPIDVVLYRDQKLNVARILVRDRGMGIPPEMLDKIFKCYERAVSGDQISGLGLGLYIVRQLVEAHGGSIRVESNLGTGSIFIVELPLAAFADER